MPLYPLRPKTALMLSLFAALFGPSAAAADASDWDVTLGLAAGVAPEYLGGKDLEAEPDLVLDIVWKDRLFIGTMGDPASQFTGEVVSGGIFFANTGSFQAGVALGYDAGRDEDDNRRLRGLGDIDDAALGRLFLSYTAGPAQLSTSVVRSFGGSDGTLVGVALSAMEPLSEQLLVYTSVSAAWADSKYMSSYFGVSSAQSLRSGLARFSAGPGIRNVDAMLGATLYVTEQWSVDATGGVGRLLGDAADSPITQRRYQPFGAISLNYSF